VKEWTCATCSKSVVYGFKITGELITAHRQVYSTEVTTICGSCLPIAVQVTVSKLNEGIAKIMGGYDGPYNPTKDLPIVGGIQIRTEWHAVPDAVPNEATP
jgi:hypothetical protein